MTKVGYVYIVSNIQRSVFYIGVTSDLRQRIFEHKEEKGSKFTSKYRCTYLVYYEILGDISFAIEREKQLKNWHRNWKINLIKSMNPDMRDLYEEV
ncbi:GIY-YIG nuclease family protein [Desertivirga xinjiangensis]|uniref:GIY-YIG nuclease family protein n=1 Tax=Desertivirga xinjiangensis TaxID=539206 RepID=UPI00210A73F8|nr:GIY-YIG nuclease family protein [Pedobacter xinjiangensis]